MGELGTDVFAGLDTADIRQLGCASVAQIGEFRSTCLIDSTETKAGSHSQTESVKVAL